MVDNRVLFVSELELNFPDRLARAGPECRSLRRGKDAIDLLVENDQRHAFAEALRSLRSSLIFLPLQGAAPRSILITSAVPNEGKSVIAANLAVTLPSPAPASCSSMATCAGARCTSNSACRISCGFADVLQDPAAHPWRAAAQKTQTQNLSAPLPRGHHLSPRGAIPPRGTNASCGKSMPSIDYVIIDSAPVMVADDTTSLAPKIDATLFVVRYGFSSIRTSLKALDLLRDRQANMLGLVCNDVEISAQEYNYYRYPEYYGAPAASKT